MSFRYISLFSGFGGAELAWGPLGWECAAVAEVDPAACAVLAHRWPHVPNLGDVEKITEQRIAELGPVDMVVFGSPCQDLSVAGKRGGLKGERSGLFFDAMRIVRWSGARFALWENVPGAFSSQEGRDFALVVGEMAGVRVDVPDGGWRNSGFLQGDAGLVEWAVLDAQFFGVPQRRRRIFALRDIGDWKGRPPILLERESLCGHPAPSRKAGQGITHELAPSLTNSGRGVERGGDSRGQDPVVPVFEGGRVRLPESGHKPGASQQRVSDAQLEPGPESELSYSRIAICMSTGQGSAEIGIGIGIGTTLNCNHEAPILANPVLAGGHATNPPDETLITKAVAWKPAHYTRGKDGAPCEITPPLSADADKGDQDTLIAFSCKDHGADAGDLSPTLRSMELDGSPANGGGQVAIAIQERAICENPDAGPDGVGIRTDDTTYKVEARQVPQAVAFRASGQDGFTPGLVAPPVASTDGGGAGVPTIAISGRARGDDGRGYERPEHISEEVASTLDGVKVDAVAFQSSQSGVRQVEQAPTLDSHNGSRRHNGIIQAMQVRRLTPIETARLQGVSDDHCRIPYKGRVMADGPIYKMHGNGFCVNVVNWIGRRIQDVALGE